MRFSDVFVASSQIGSCVNQQVIVSGMRRPEQGILTRAMRRRLVVSIPVITR